MARLAGTVHGKHMGLHHMHSQSAQLKMVQLFMFRSNLP